MFSIFEGFPALYVALHAALVVALAASFDACLILYFMLLFAVVPAPGLVGA